MRVPDIASDGVDRYARRARDELLALFYIYGLGLALSLSLPMPVRGQAAIASRGAGLALQSIGAQ